MARRAQGPVPVRSELTVGASVEDGATLRWLAEPGVAAAGSDHRSGARIGLSARARLLWREEFVLGRHGEEPGTWTSAVRLERGGVPLLVAELGAGPAAAGWASRAVGGGARAVSAVIVVDPDRPAGTWAPGRASTGRARGAALGLPGPGVQLLAWGETLGACREVLARLWAVLDPPAWAGPDPTSA